MDDIEEMIDDCEARSEYLSDWECDFIDSLRSQMEAGRVLSFRQEEKLCEIWTAVTKIGVIK